MALGILFAFLFGIGNFALHQAVLNSRHPILGQMPWLFQRMGGRFSLVLEFAMLLGTMLLIADGSQGWAVGYACYSTVNAVSAWLILTGRV